MTSSAWGGLSVPHAVLPLPLLLSVISPFRVSRAAPVPSARQTPPRRPDALGSLPEVRAAPIRLQPSAAPRAAVPSGGAAGGAIILPLRRETY
ncbi:hypothetical protein EYF80_060647 [Liparis tanakae]|uniref:Secreted protein n=1 Tax=Liparis tanakae TaxID=230148 RepID=A0A4Z2EKC7_9TELE|nr:hypothetical protein EYF80_060647 [Liparis tanakae]